MSGALRTWAGSLSDRRRGLAVLAIGLVLPLFSIAVVAATGLDFAHGLYETGKYSVPAIGLLQQGELGTFVDGRWEPEIQRLPMFLWFLAGSFALFGIDNYLPIVLLQAVMAAVTVWAIARTAETVDASLLWPAALLAAVTPGLGYRASIVLPESLFVMFVALALLGLVRAARGRRTTASLLLLAAATAAAMATRPAFLLMPALLSLGFLLCLLQWRGLSLRRSLLAALVPLLAGGLIYTAQGLRVQAHTGHFAYTTQTGVNLLRWAYPCLNQPLGCGEVPREAFDRAEAAYAERARQLTPEELGNRVVVDRLRAEVAKDLMLQMPVLDLLVSATGAALKMLMHTTAVEILERYGAERVLPGMAPGAGFGERVANYLGMLAGAPQMWPWILAQALLFALRGVQIVGLVGGLLSPQRRALTLTCLLVILGFTAPALGLGNPRYRAPIEPVIVLLTLQGSVILRDWWRASRGVPKSDPAV